MEPQANQERKNIQRNIQKNKIRTNLLKIADYEFSTQMKKSTMQINSHTPQEIIKFYELHYVVNFHEEINAVKSKKSETVATLNNSELIGREASKELEKNYGAKVGGIRKISVAKKKLENNTKNLFKMKNMNADNDICFKRNDSNLNNLDNDILMLDNSDEKIYHSPPIFCVDKAHYTKLEYDSLEILHIICFGQKRKSKFDDKGKKSNEDKQKTPETRYGNFSKSDNKGKSDKNKHSFKDFKESLNLESTMEDRSKSNKKAKSGKVRENLLDFNEIFCKDAILKLDVDNKIDLEQSNNFSCSINNSKLESSRILLLDLKEKSNSNLSAYFEDPIVFKCGMKKKLSGILQSSNFIHLKKEVITSSNLDTDYLENAENAKDNVAMISSKKVPSEKKTGCGKGNQNIPQRQLSNNSISINSPIKDKEFLANTFFLNNNNNFIFNLEEDNLRDTVKTLNLNISSQDDFTDKILEYNDNNSPVFKRKCSDDDNFNYNADNVLNTENAENVENAENENVHTVNNNEFQYNTYNTNNTNKILDSVDDFKFTSQNFVIHNACFNDNNKYSNKFDNDNNYNIDNNKSDYDNDVDYEFSSRFRLGSFNSIKLSNQLQSFGRSSSFVDKSLNSSISDECSLELNIEEINKQLKT